MNIVITPNLMLSDALERAYANTVQNASQPISLKKSLVAVGRTLRRGAKAFARGAGAVINAQAEARARSMQYTRTPW